MTKQKEPLKIGDKVRIDAVPDVVFEVTSKEGFYYAGKPVGFTYDTHSFTRRQVTHRIVKKKKRGAREFYVSPISIEKLDDLQGVMTTRLNIWKTPCAGEYVKFREVLDE